MQAGTSIMERPDDWPSTTANRGRHTLHSVRALLSITRRRADRDALCYARRVHLGPAAAVPLGLLISCGEVIPYSSLPPSMQPERCSIRVSVDSDEPCGDPTCGWPPGYDPVRAGDINLVLNGEFDTSLDFVVENRSQYSVGFHGRASRSQCEFPVDFDAVEVRARAYIEGSTRDSWTLVSGPSCASGVHSFVLSPGEHVTGTLPTPSPSDNTMALRLAVALHSPSDRTRETMAYLPLPTRSSSLDERHKSAEP